VRVHFYGQGLRKSEKFFFKRGLVAADRGVFEAKVAAQMGDFARSIADWATCSHGNAHRVILKGERHS